MSLFQRLSRTVSTVRGRALPIWETTVPKLKHAGQRLSNTWVQSEKACLWVASHPNLAFAPIGIFGVIYLLRIQQAAAAATLAGAWFALARHFSQTEADRRRRITESYSKAVSQLASEKVEERLGGIYTLESISKESLADYWTVMETLTAFVRERSRRDERERVSVDLEVRIDTRAYFLWLAAGRPEGQSEKHKAEAIELEKLGEPPPTDIAAVLTAIRRRSERHRKREDANAWHLDLRGTFLRRANLEGEGTRLERADLRFAHLEGAFVSRAHLEGAHLWEAHLENAFLWGTHLEGADLESAHLEGANLWGAYLKSANLRRADFRGANLKLADLLDADLCGANLHGAENLLQGQLHFTLGDAATQLPEGLIRPPNWPDQAPAKPFPFAKPRKSGFGAL